MQTEIKQFEKEISEWDNAYLSQSLDNTMDYTYREKVIIKSEILNRLEKNNIEEFKKKLIEEIKQYNLKVDNRTKMMSENVVEDLINNIGKEK